MEGITIYIVVYVVLIAVILYCFCFKHNSENKWVTFTQKHLWIMLFLLAVNSISFGLSLKKQEEDYYIKRGEPDEQEEQYLFRAVSGEETYDFSLTVPPRSLKPKEANEKMEKAFAYLDENIKGDNESLDHVNCNLNLTLDRGEYPFEMEVISSEYSLMDEEGILRNEDKQLEALGYTASDMLSGIPINVTIRLRYKEIEKEKKYSLTVFPKEKNELEKLVSNIEKMYQRKEDESLYEEGFYLPAKYKDLIIEYPAEEGIRPGAVLIIGCIMAGLLLLKEVEAKKAGEIKHRQELLQSYPWFINEMVLLMGAGMQVRNVFSSLVNNYEKETSDYRSGLISELKHAKHDFEIGMSEGKVYYELGRRLKLPCYIKILTLLEQNATKGSKGIVAVLEHEERNALEERMNLAKKRAEEAGTKLLGPMIMLLIIVMLMIMIPAFLSFM